jgi:hypothetical protein
MAKIDHHVELIGAGLGERACFRDLDRGGGVTSGRKTYRTAYER